ncbi:MAG TPA: VanZ family protein [Chryseolinea sp.]|nr:VanZ family protein [Chryseolinea sp.]
MRISIKTFWPAAISLIGATVLFCLPGDEFPEKSWFDKIYLDKWVHVGLFAVLVLLWSLPLLHKIKIHSRLQKALVWTAVAFVVYGIIIELIQGRFIPHRTFGVDDMVADAIGCGLGFFLANRQTNH